MLMMCREGDAPAEWIFVHRLAAMSPGIITVSYSDFVYGALGL